MKKTGSMPKMNLGPPRPKRKSEKEKKLDLNRSKSVEGLMRSPRGTILQRKASTPTNDQPPSTVSPNISLISTKSRSPGTSTVPLKKCIEPQTGSSAEITIEEELKFEYMDYIHGVFEKKLDEKKASALDNEIAKVQKRIEDNQSILLKTTERLKNINFNKEIDTLYNLHNPNYAKALETLNSCNYEEHLSAIYEKLEKTQNQLKIKNIDIPQGGMAQLVKLIEETKVALETVKTNNDVETPKVLQEINELTENSYGLLYGCVENLPEAESLVLRRITMEISNRDSIQN